MASGRIKGITIEIGGDTTKLQTALKGVDKSLKTTQSNLKDINKLLKLDPGNTELLTQKQKNLKSAISDTKDRLKELKNAQSQVSEGTAEWDSLQREIIATEQDLKSLKKEYSDFGSVAKQKMEAVGSKMQEVGGKVKDVGAGFTKNVTVPIAAIGAASIAAFNEVDAGADIMIKKTGATGEAAAELQGIMESLATTIPTDFETAGTAIGEVNTRFGLTGEELEKLSGQFVKFAQLNDTDVSSSIDSVQKALAAFGLDASSAEGLLDTLNATGQATGISMETLTAGLVTNGVAFQQMGLDINQATTLMGQLETSGVDSTKMMSGLRKALKNAAKDGKPMNQALAEMQKAILDDTSATGGLTAAYELFGGAGDQVYAAVKSGTLDFNALATAATESGGSVSTTFEETLDPMDKFQTTMNNLKIVGAELGGTLMEVLTPILEKVAEVVQTLKEKWDALSPSQQDMIVKVGLIAAALGPVIMLIGTLITSIGSIVGAIGMLFNPIGLVVAAIGGLVAAGVWLYKNWDTIKEKAAQLKEKVSKAWSSLKEKVSTAASNMKEKVVTAWNAVNENTAEKWSAVRSKISETWSNIKSTVSEKVSSLKADISEKWSSIKSNMAEKLSDMKSNASEKWSSIKSSITEKVGDIKSSLSEKWGAIKSTMSEKFGAMATTAGEKFGDIKSKMTEKIEAARDAIGLAIDKVKGFFNFDWSLPPLKLPHFSITGKFSLNPPSIPHLSVEWYKKAYDNPFLFTSPTVVGGKGFGDGGGSGEIVYGRDALLRDIAQAKGGDEITINVYAPDGMNINQLADRVQNKLAQAQQRKAAVYA